MPQEPELEIQPPKTLGEWRDFWVQLVGEDSGGTKFLDAKIGEQGRDMEVLADPSQMWMLLKHAHLNQ